MVKASVRQVLRQGLEVEASKRPLPNLKEVNARRQMTGEAGESAAPAAPRSSFVDVIGTKYPVPDWLPTEEYIDDVLGPIKSGKEADVFLVERSSPKKSCLLALKKYKAVSERAFRRDQIYTEGRRVRETRLKRAIEQGTRVGKAALSADWGGREFGYLRQLWLEGADVPYPVEGEGGGSLLMQFIGNAERAGSRLVDARLTKQEAEPVFEQILGNIDLFARLGLVHGDLSAYNVLVWQGKSWIIDFPQAAAISLNPHAIDLLERDLRNVCTYFRKFGLIKDPGEELARILGDIILI